MPDPVKVTLKTFLKTDYRMKKIGTLIIEKPSDMFQISITELFMLIAIVNAVDCDQNSENKREAENAQQPERQFGIMTLVKIEYEPTEANFGTTTI